MSLSSGESSVCSEEAPTPEAQGHPHRQHVATHIPWDITRAPTPSREPALSLSSEAGQSSRCTPVVHPHLPGHTTHPDGDHIGGTKD